MRLIHGIWLMAMLAGAGPLAAQDTPEVRPPTAAERARAMIEEERQMVSSKGRRADCPAPDPLGKSIVVCAPDTTERYRVAPGDDDPDPRSTRGHGLTPPNVSGAPNCTQVCIRGGYAPPPVYYIDLSKIPEAPPGSDADKIAKGEARAP
jgi:hypothetical protein